VSEKLEVFFFFEKALQLHYLRNFVPCIISDGLSASHHRKQKRKEEKE